MSDGVIGLLAALLVAALTGETVIAYRHPRQFKVLFWGISGVLLTLGLIFFVWNTSNEWARMAMSEPDLSLWAERDKLRAQAASVEVPTWTFIVIAVFYLYSMFLSSFPHWLFKMEKD